MDRHVHVEGFSKNKGGEGGNGGIFSRAVMAGGWTTSKKRTTAMVTALKSGPRRGRGM